MDTKQMTTQIRRLFEEGFSKGNLSIMDEVCANNVRLHDAAQPNLKEGLTTLKEVESNYNKAFPNKKVKIDELITADNKIIVRWTCQGVHKGNFEGISPTNKPFTITGISIYGFTNGKINEIWQTWDRLGLFEQIGEF